jgi:hypothetical protein
MTLPFVIIVLGLLFIAQDRQQAIIVAAMQ